MSDEPDTSTADPYEGPVPAWRVGRSNGRTLYRQLGSEPSKSDPMIGSMDTRELAAEAVAAVNGQRSRLKHGGANAEDCPICMWRKDLPYPFICTEEEGGQ